MKDSYEELLAKYPDRLQAINNVLTEAAWFYKSDAPDLFYELQHYEEAFRDFYRRNFDWELRIDKKCARLVKKKVYNEALGHAGLVEFKLKGRDEYVAFLLLIEFYEKLLGDQALSVEDHDNPTFTFGEYLDHVTNRMAGLFPERKDLDAESVKKKILRPLMEKLIDYRFLREMDKEGVRVDFDKTIYEALPACYSYNAAALEKHIGELHHGD